MTSPRDIDDEWESGEAVEMGTPPIGTPPTPEPSAAARSTVINVSTAPKDRRPLNPAIAILAGAILTTTSGILVAFLSIRSSERLSNERAKTDAAVKSGSDLQRKVDQLERDLTDASRQIKTLATTAPPTPPAASNSPLPSIVVVISTPAAPTTLAPKTSAPTTAASVAPAPATTVATAAPTTVASTTTTSTTTTSAPTSSSPSTSASPTTKV